MIEVTRIYCPESGGKPGEDNTTHHLVPMTRNGSRVHVCRYCRKTEKELRDAAGEA